MRGTKERVLAVLRQHERSQAWLARKMGMNATLLSHYLAERRPQPPDLLDRIAAALNCNPDELRPVEDKAA